MELKRLGPLTSMRTKRLANMLTVVFDFTMMLGFVQTQAT